MDSRRIPGEITLRHHIAVIGYMRRGGLPGSLVSKAVAVIDSFIYGFTLQEANLPGGGGGEMVGLGKELSEGVMKRYPYLLELTGYVATPEYNFSNAFVYGLELILDGFERESSS